MLYKWTLWELRFTNGPCGSWPEGNDVAGVRKRHAELRNWTGAEGPAVRPGAPHSEDDGRTRAFQGRVHIARLYWDVTALLPGRVMDTPGLVPGSVLGTPGLGLTLTGRRHAGARAAAVANPYTVSLLDIRISSFSPRVPGPYKLETV